MDSIDPKRNPKTNEDVVEYKLIAEPLEPRSYKVYIKGFGANPPGEVLPFDTFECAYLRIKDDPSECALLRSGGDFFFRAEVF